MLVDIYPGASRGRRVAVSEFSQLGRLVTPTGHIRRCLGCSESVVWWDWRVRNSLERCSLSEYGMAVKRDRRFRR